MTAFDAFCVVLFIADVIVLGIFAVGMTLCIKDEILKRRKTK